MGRPMRGCGGTKMKGATSLKRERGSTVVFRIGVCDDEQLELDRLTGLIREYFDRTSQPYLLCTFQTGEDLLAEFKTGFDILFLDIYLGSENGVDLACRIRERDKSCILIFATNSKTDTLRGYGVRAMGYLLKPIDVAELKGTLDAAMEDLASRETVSIQIQNRNGCYRIRLEDILFVESSARLLTVHTRTQGEITYYDQLNKLEALCGDQRFLRCHKSYLVNLDYVLAVVGDKLHLMDGGLLPISISVSKAKEAFASHLASLA